MFITKHLLALVALAVGAASSCDVCSKELYDGKCGGLLQEAKGKWDDWMVEGAEIIGCIDDVCCASDEDDCCEPNVGAIVGLVIALVVVIGGCIFMCCRESIVACCREYFPDDTTYGVTVPPGPLGLKFQNGTCTVHAVTHRSPLRGVTKRGETLVSVNGKPVNAATMLDEIKGADDGTSERMLIFRRASSSKFLLALAAGETENGPIVSKENAV